MKHPESDGLMEELHRLMAEELDAFLRYFRLRYCLCGPDRVAAERFFDKAMDETLIHARAIASHIRVLGDTPKVNIRLEAAGGALELAEALEDALIFEQQALGAYEDMLPRVAGQPGLESFIRQQIATETEHVREIAMLLELSPGDRGRRLRAADGGAQSQERITKQIGLTGKE